MVNNHDLAGNCNRLIRSEEQNCISLIYNVGFRKSHIYMLGSLISEPCRKGFYLFRSIQRCGSRTRADSVTPNAIRSNLNCHILGKSQHTQDVSFLVVHLSLFAHITYIITCKR